MIQVGDSVKFKPFMGICVPGFGGTIITAIGTVIEIFEEHSWFSVEYELSGVKHRTSFHFADIGKYVEVLR